MKTLLLIDANSIIHRSFHALPPFTTPEGKPSGAIYGIASILLKLWREGKPDYVAAAFDRPEPTFRDAKYKEYKAQRPKAPDELISQIIETHKLFDAFGIRTFERAGFEADDIIATLAERFKKEPDLRVVILTGDRDTLQLVEDDKVVVQTFNKGVSDTTTYDERAVIEKYGLAPAQLIDYKALVGDPSDNIKGVPGVGPKTATELLQKFGTVKKIYENIKTDPKLEKKFALYRKDAELSGELVTLVRDVPLGDLPLGDLAPRDGIESAQAYFKTMGFATLLARLEGKEPPPRKKKLPPAKPAQSAEVREPGGPKGVQGTMF